MRVLYKAGTEAAWMAQTTGDPKWVDKLSLFKSIANRRFSCTLYASPSKIDIDERALF